MEAEPAALVATCRQAEPFEIVTPVELPAENGIYMVEAGRQALPRTYSYVHDTRDVHRRISAVHWAPHYRRTRARVWYPVTPGMRNHSARRCAHRSGGRRFARPAHRGRRARRRIARFAHGAQPASPCWRTRRRVPLVTQRAAGSISGRRASRKWKRGRRSERAMRARRAVSRAR